MCYSGEMSAFFALSGVGMAAYLRYVKGRPMRVCLGILYFAAMELLQTVQYLWIAEPEDGYAMCKNPVNQFLTFVGLVHIWFQPVFSNMMFTGNRRHSLKTRIQGDLVNKLCLLGVAAMATRYFLAILWPENPAMAPRPTEDCPNYEWVRDGYDGLLGFETPNLPGHSCTFRSASSSGHLAWAVPLYQATYFVPGTFLHSFLMLAPVLARAEEWWEFAYAFFFAVTGPILAAYLTSSLNEQASIWCFYSMFQCLFAFIVILFRNEEPFHPKVAHVGTLGEAPMAYDLVVEKKTMSNGHSNNGHANGVNGKKVN